MVSREKQCQGIFQSVCCLAVLVGSGIEVAKSAPIVAHPNGGLIRSTGVTETGGVTRLIGSSSSLNQGLSNIYFFELPTLANDQIITQVDLDFNYAALEASTTFNTDLYGLGFVSGPPSMSGSWFFEGPGTDTRTRASLGTGSTGVVSLLDDNILTPSTSTGHIQTTGTTTGLIDFVQSLYADGATGGDFAVFHFVADQVVSGPTTTLGYRITHSGGAANDLGVLDITVATVPEPSSILLLGLGALGLVRHTRRRQALRGKE